MTWTVRCTREEYLAFCTETAPRPLWTVAVGVVFEAAAVAEILLFGGLSQVGLLLLLGGIVCLSAVSLIIPLWCKGSAGRRYDNSDDLRQAIQVTFREDAVAVRSATVEGTFPMSSVTGVIKTKTMLAVVFGKEYTVYIPTRVMTDEESATALEMLKKGTHR